MLTKQDKEKIALIKMKTKAQATLKKIRLVEARMEILIRAIDKRLSK